MPQVYISHGQAHGTYRARRFGVGVGHGPTYGIIGVDTTPIGRAVRANRR